MVRDSERCQGLTGTSTALPGASSDETAGALPAGAVRLDGCVVRAGATSWAARSLVSSGGFYPRRTMTARDRLGFYAGTLPLAEIATTFRFPPTPELAASWAERTPPGFAFDVRGWSLLTGCPTLPDSLWADLQGEVAPARRDNRRLYPQHLTPAALEECWARFAHALGPLAAASRLGVVILTYPGWFSPRAEAWEELARLPRRLPGLRVAVELRSPRWFEGAQADATLEWLEEHGLGFVCVDGPAEGESAGPAVVAATSEVAVVRFRGRRHVEGDPWTWPYRYGTAELGAWVPSVAALAATSSEVHLLMDNCHGTDAVDNARDLLALLAA